MSKRYKESLERIDEDKLYGVEEAVEILKGQPACKFDETIEISFLLGIDPKLSEHQVRGTVLLPHGTGKKVKVLVIAQGEGLAGAERGGADMAGGKEYIDKIASGWLDFDVMITTPDMMKEVARLGKILGGRGLMPSPKKGTVTPKIEEAVKEIKMGRIEFRADKGGNLHLICGKKSFSNEQLTGNIREITHTVTHARPASLKGKFIKKAVISTAMGPGIKLIV